MNRIFFNGWTHDHYISSVLVFCPDGKIRICLINAPSVFHDSAMSDYMCYEAMERVYLNTSGKVVVDSAFNINTGDGFIIKSTQRDPDDVIALLVNRDAMYVR